MITRSSLKRDIDALRSIVIKLSDYVEQHTEIHVDLDAYLDQLDSKILDLDTQLTQLSTSYSREICEVDLQIDKIWKFCQNLDSVQADLDLKVTALETHIEFLDDNKDALEMWIECVRQTQQLYKESQQPVDTE